MFRIAVLCLLTIVSCSEESFLELQQQITNTEQLIFLYQQKLGLLKSIYQQKYPNHPYNITIPTSNRPLTRQSPHLILVNKFDYQSVLFQNPLAIHNNKLINLENSQTIAEFIGQVLILEENAITTLTGGKTSMLKIRQEEGKMQTEEEYLGLNADKLPSIWHRNYNIKDGEDLLIQWLKNKIYLRGKELNVITLNPDEEVLNLYSFNQYKIIFVSTHRIGVINSRSLQIGEFEAASNITKLTNSSAEVTIRQSFKQDSLVIVLLSTGQVVSYFHPKIVSVQLLPTLKQDFNLSSCSLHIQYLHPYLFVADGQVGSIKVFEGQMGRFQKTIDIDLRSTFTSLTFFKQNDSFRMFLSNTQQTKIFQLLLPKAEEPVGNYNYLKLFGIFVVVAIFIYLKWFKKGSSEQAQQKELQRMKAPASRMQKEKIDNKQKPRFTQSEIEQFLKRESRQNITPSNYKKNA